MQRFKSAGSAQKFLSTHAAVTQRRIVSYEIAIPRSASKSSTSRKLSVNRR